ncbi:hypothetical protein [Deinococcus sedimenti]|uniref:hypothetical protein n=1 Tax=Deinococcus sedimenti TaxID=1867090 RepID=UPI0035711F25
MHSGKPWKNWYGKSFHSRLREERLYLEVLYSARRAQVGLAGYRAVFNQEFLHLLESLPHDIMRPKKGEISVSTSFSPSLPEGEFWP